MHYQNLIEITPGKRSGKPCVAGTRITVADVLGWLANGMDEAAILSDYPELTSAHVRACIAYPSDCGILPPQH